MLYQAQAPRFPYPPRSEITTKPEKDEFDIRYAVWLGGHEKHPVLGQGMKSEISSYSAKWLFNDEIRPHVVLKLQFSKPYTVERKRYTACLLHMSRQTSTDNRADEFFDLDGAGVILLQFVSDASEWNRVPSVEFHFKSPRHQTLRSIVYVIEGRTGGLPLDMRCDLRNFHFFGPLADCGKHRVFCGGRDWICQLFIRLHYLGWTDWHISGTRLILPSTNPTPNNNSNSHKPQIFESPAAYAKYRPQPITDEYKRRHQTQPQTINWAKAGFHDIIGRKFHLPTQAVPGVVLYEAMDVKEGWTRPLHTQYYRSQRAPVCTLPYGADYPAPAPVEGSGCAGGYLCHGGHHTQPSTGDGGSASSSSARAGAAGSKTESQSGSGPKVSQAKTGNNGTSKLGQSGPSMQGGTAGKPGAGPVPKAKGKKKVLGCFWR